MSYPGVDPGDTQTMNPVGTQDVSSGAIPQPDLNQVAAQARKAVEDMFSVTDSWKPKDTSVKFKHEFPSGQVSLVKHLGTMDLIEYGLIEELNFFVRKLFPASFDPSGNPVEAEEDSETLLQSLVDPAKRKRFLDLTGKLLAASSVRPAIIHDGVAVIDVTEDGKEKRKVVFGYQYVNKPMDEQIKVFGAPVPKAGEGQAYSGVVDFEDRMSLFYALNKPLKEIEPFRDESPTVLQDLAGVEGDGSKAE